MRLSVLLCEENENYWFSGAVGKIGRACGLGKVEFIHAALLVDTTDIGGSAWVYDLTDEGIVTSTPEEFEEPVGRVYTQFLDRDDLYDVRYIKSVVDRINFSIEADMRLDWMDLARLCLRRPLRNHTCCSFVWFALGNERCHEMRTVDQLGEMLENDCRYIINV